MNDEDMPFVLLPIGDGRFELRAFSDDSDDPIVLALDDADGRAVADALGRVLEAHGPSAESLLVGSRRMTIESSDDGTVRFRVDR